MKGRQAAIVLGVFLGALGTQGLVAGDDDRAVPRGGGSSGGGSNVGGSHGGGGGFSSATERHPGRSGSDSSLTYSAVSHSGDDDRAVPRGGGSSGGGSNAGSSRGGGGGSSSATGRHPGSSGSGSSRTYSESSRSDDDSARAVPRTEAQRRHPRPGTGTGFRDGRGGRYYGGGYYYRPYGYGYWPYYDDYYWSYGYFSSPWYYPRYHGGFYGGGYYGSPYHRGYYSRSGSVRVLVEPRDTKVYVDDYYAGTADDFDGILQRLNLTPGRHDIALKLDGFETHKVKLYVPLDHTIKIRHKMVRGASDSVSEQTVGDPADEARYARRNDDDEGRDDDRGERRDRGDDSWPAARERGTLRLEVSPADASIYVDGTFRGTGEDLRRLSLPPGRHRLEVVRPGYRTLERDVEVQAGETEEVEVDLQKS